MALKQSYQEKRGVKLSYNDIMAKAIAVASRKFPLVNARCEGGEVRVYRHTNVGLAVGLEGALLVPVVKGIDTMGLEEIADKYRQVVKRPGTANWPPRTWDVAALPSPIWVCLTWISLLPSLIRRRAVSWRWDGSLCSLFGTDSSSSPSI